MCDVFRVRNYNFYARQLDHSDFNSIILLIHLASLHQRFQSVLILDRLNNLSASFTKRVRRDCSRLLREATEEDLTFLH